REGLLQNGLWWQSAIDIHMEWKSPEPEYLRSYHKGAQIAAMPWPFSPADVPVLPAQPDKEDSYMLIFPNPTATGSFYIIPNSGNQIPYKRFYIRDMQGRLVYESVLNDFFNAQEVRMPQHLNAGVYHVVFAGDQARESHRLVLIK
ncbi:MAG: T9SS type A sorting domain-containing protein, partial [Cryomorphaceae bacterium]